MISEMDSYCTKIKIFDEKDSLILESFLSKLPLTEKAYEDKGQEILGNSYPCMIERKFIEKTVCVHVMNKVEKERYEYDEFKWFFDLYGLNGSYVLFIR